MADVAAVAAITPVVSATGAGGRVVVDYLVDRQAVIQRYALTIDTFISNDNPSSLLTSYTNR